jgi:hypothetical protein
MWLDSLKLVTLIIHSIAGVVVGYVLKRFLIPRILHIYGLQLHAWYWRYPLFEGISMLCSAITTLQYESFSWSSLGFLVNGYEQLYAALEGSVVAYSSLRLFSDGYYRLTGRDGLGRGDVKLFSVFRCLVWMRCIAGHFYQLLL